MSTDATRLDLRIRRRGMIGYAVGMALYVFAVVALYPTFRNDSALDGFTSGNSSVAALFGASGSLTTPVGWMDANVYNNFLPLVALSVTISYGAWCIAGQDEDGTLGLVASLPIRRRTIVVQKALALALVALPTALVTAVVTVLGRYFDLHLGLGRLFGATFTVLLLGIDFGALAMLIGAWTGSRTTALSVASAIAAVSYLVSSLAPVTAWVRPLRFGSLFYWAVGDAQLANGPGLGHVVVLVLSGGILLAAAVPAFDRLDIH